MFSSPRQVTDPLAYLAQTHVVGGDTSESSVLSVACTAVGTVPEDRVITRLGASPGDTVFATGRLGLGAALAAVQLLNLPESLMGEGDFRPSLRLAEGRALRGCAGCCMDTSDGLLATLDQLARLNDVAILVDEDPYGLLHPIAERLRSTLSLTPLPILAAAHGEFELVFTIAKSRQSCFRDLCSANGFAPVRLGTVESGNGVHVSGRCIDTTGIQNLGFVAGADPQQYFEQLVALCA
jgi:thiamine-monophosphate kinase